MAVTNIVTVTKSWTQIAMGSCLIQDKNKNCLYNICVQSAQPAPTDENYIVTDLSDSTVFDFATPVWCRVDAGTYANSRKITVIT